MDCCRTKTCRTPSHSGTRGSVCVCVEGGGGGGGYSKNIKKFKHPKNI